MPTPRPSEFEVRRAVFLLRLQTLVSVCNVEVSTTTNGDVLFFDCLTGQPLLRVGETEPLSWAIERTQGEF